MSKNLDETWSTLSLHVSNIVLCVVQMWSLCSVSDQRDGCSGPRPLRPAHSGPVRRPHITAGASPRARTPDPTEPHPRDSAAGLHHLHVTTHPPTQTHTGAYSVTNRGGCNHRPGKNTSLFVTEGIKPWTLCWILRQICPTYRTEDVSGQAALLLNPQVRRIFVAYPWVRYQSSFWFLVTFSFGVCKDLIN